MTDRERLLDLLGSFGISPVTRDNPPPYSMDPEAEGERVLLVSGAGGVSGYSGFYCQFDFAEDGKFTGVSVFE